MRQFRKAERRAIPLRVALMGKSGQGKTYSALALALHLASSPERVGVIDSEVVEGPAGLVASAEKYVGEPCRCSECQGHGITFGAFSTLELPPGERKPADYVQAIAAAKAAGFEVLVVDSISHEWEGCLDLAGGKFTGWKEAGKAHDAFMAALMAYPGHVIATMRTKEKSTQETGDNGRQNVRALGELPVQRQGVEYEFDVLVYLSAAAGEVVKSRSARLAQVRTFPQPGKTLAGELAAWAAGPEGERERAAGEELAALRREATAAWEALPPEGREELRAAFAAGKADPKALASAAEKARAWVAARKRAALEAELSEPVGPDSFGGSDYPDPDDLGGLDLGEPVGAEPEELEV